MDLIVYTSLTFIVAIYAWILQRTKKRLEPDFAWLEVVIGCALCLIAAAARARLVPGDWHEYERGVWWAFVIGGAVIIAWQIGQSIRRQEEVRKRGRESAAALAEQRRERPANDD